MMSFGQRVEENNGCLEEQNNNNKFTFVLRETSRKSSIKVGAKEEPRIASSENNDFVSYRPVYKICIDPINPYRPIA